MAVQVTEMDNQNQAPKQYPVEPEQVARSIRDWEKIANILWLVLGIIQCFTLAGIPCGVFNIIMSVRGLKNSKLIAVGQQWVIGYYENSLISLIIAAVVNLIIGGFIGVALVIFEFIIRDYALKHRYAFE